MNKLSFLIIAVLVMPIQISTIDISHNSLTSPTDQPQSYLPTTPNISIGIDHHDKWFEEGRRNWVFLNQFDIDSTGNIWTVGNIRDGQAIWTNDDTFISKINPEGEIEFLRIFNGSNLDYGNAIAVDSKDNVILATQTGSPDLPVVNGQGPTYERRFIHDYYIAKMDPQGNILWSTYLGGELWECCANVDVDEFDNIYLQGMVVQGSKYFDTVNDFLNDTGGGWDTYVAKFTPNGILEWSTFFGGSGREQMPVYYLGEGRLIFFGFSNSLDYDFYGPMLPHFNGSGEDIAILELNVTSNKIMWSSLLGGSGQDLILKTKPALDNNELLIGGNTQSHDFPLLASFDGELDGISDGFITLLSENRELIWSSYLGGSKSDFVMGFDFLNDEEILVVGTTESQDFPITDNSKFANDTGAAFLARVYRNGSGIIESTLFSPISEEGSGDYLIYFQEKHNRYIIAGNTIEKSWFHNNQTVQSHYPFVFSETNNGFVYQFNPLTLEPIMFTSTVLVPDPDLDYDGDGIDNWEEYRLYFDEGQALDPLDPDTDDDGLPDGWEVEFGLDADDKTEPSSNEDSFDLDGLSNLDEYKFGTWPNVSDTDGDGMDDKYEFDNGLDGLLDDTDEDFDNDLMPNWYEAQHNFIASNSSDGLDDPDKDFAVNSREFFANTDPFNNDTDGDLLLDGYELDNGLDPTTNDLNGDIDGDLIPNWVEAKYNLRPDNPIETLLLIAFLASIIAIFATVKIKSRSRNKKAVEEGFNSYAHKKKLQNHGFSSIEQFEMAKNQGFNHQKVLRLFEKIGYSSVGEFLVSVEQIQSNVDNNLNAKAISENLEIIEQVKTPLELQSKRPLLMDFSKKIQKVVSQIDKILDMKDKLDNLFSSKIDIFIEINQSDLEQYHNELKIRKVKLQTHINKIEQVVRNKEAYLRPWYPLLKLINITEAGKPVSINDIVEVIETSEEQAVEIITALLEENPIIGDYDPVTRTYVKSNKATAFSYIQKAMRSIEEYQHGTN